MFPIINPPPPAEAENSKASPGAACEVSAPIANPYFIILDFTKAKQVCIAAVPALHANSKSATINSGVAPIDSPTIVPEGLTAYG